MGPELFDLTGKVALVTGSSRGLGSAIAEGLAAAGATIILNGINEERLEKAVETMRQKGFDTHGYSFDVTKTEQIKEKIEQIQTQVGQIDILVNNAGIQIRTPLEDFSEEDWRKVIDTNLTSAFLVTKQVVKEMIKRKSGKIINICSLASELCRATTSPYAASKGGLKMLTRSMAVEWGKYNIQANGIGPGYFITEMTKPLADDEKFTQWLCSRAPANRWGKPCELTGAAVFLASKASSYVNGQILYVDGGLLANM